MKKRFKPKSGFSRNILTLMTGATIAQATPIAISPILTRIYTQENFGVFAIFVALISIFSTIATGKYELAIMLPKKDEDAINILALGTIITFLFSILLLAIVVVFNENITNVFNNKEIGRWLYWTPIAVFFTGIYNLLNYFNSRKKFYKDIANAAIAKSIIIAISQLTIGLLKSGASGLILGQIISLALGNLKLFCNILKEENLPKKIKKLKMIALAKKYSDFPRYTLAATLANTLSLHLTNILISLLFNIATIGLYSLVQRVLGIPSAIIGGSIGQVYFQEATNEKQTSGTVIKTFKYTIKKLAIIGTLFFLIIYFVIEDIFALVFGEDWRVAGQYAKIITPLVFVTFVVSPITITNQIYLKNKLGFYWQLGLLALYLCIMMVGHTLNIDFAQLLHSFTFIISLYYLIFLYLIYSYIKLERKKQY